MSFASVDGTVLHYRLSGSVAGPPLVLVNALGTSLNIWDEVTVPLGERYRLLCYDKRGHGLSDAPAGACSIGDHVDDLIGLASTLGLDRFFICGISIGGMIAMRLAARYPALVRALVACDTAPTIGTEAMWNERIAAVHEVGMAGIADAVVARWVSPGYRTAQTAAFGGWRNMLARCPADGYVAGCAAVRDADLGPDLAAIVAPTRVIAGEHDVSTPPELGRQLAAAIRGADFRLVRGAGHVPSIEQPRQFAELIGEHLDEVAHD